MRVDTLLKLRKLFAVLVAAVLTVLLVVSAFVFHTLHQSKLRYYANAEETSRNLAISLENFLHSHFQEVELTVHRAAEEFRTLHKNGQFNDADFSAYLRTLKERVPQARSIRGSNRDGLVIYGEEIDPNKLQSLAIREFFQRAQTERELIFGVPVKSRISGEWVWPLVYALTMPDSSFGGTVYVNMNNSRVAELFASLNIGAHGVITLLDDRRRVLHRFPDAKGVPAGSAVRLSPETMAIIAKATRRATYSAESGLDGERRIYSIEKIGAYPVYVLVGLSDQDVLAPWWGEARNAGIFLASLVALAAALLLGVRLSLQKQYQALEQLVEKDHALQGSLAALTESESRWRSLTEGLPQMVWTRTPSLRFDFLSHHWFDYTGHPPDGALAGGDWSGVIHPDDREKIDAAWKVAYAGGLPFRCDCRLRRHDGAWRMFDNHGLPQKDIDGNVICWVGGSTDITEAREAHDALLVAKEQALNAGRAKSEFVANMSHEIRSPMNAVLGMLQLLQQTRMDGRQRDYAAKAESAARSLLGLLNDILDFSKVEAGKLALDPHPFSLDKLLRDLAVVLSANVGAKDIEILFHIDPALPDWMVGDGLRLQQILLNLAGNAIKFTEHGEVLLQVQLLAHSDTSLNIAFTLRDTGIGISAAHCQRIFDGFSQAEASTARRYGGTGLGLAISQRLVHLMGGTLRVDSELGQGSAFTFNIELQRADAPPAEESALARHARLQRLNCLVVDDNPTARMVLTEMASSFGWRIDAVEDGFAALAAVAQGGAGRPYDVVFIDWRMPTLDGWETSRQIRKLTPADTTPLIVMVTGHDREMLAQKQAHLASVLDGVLVKPVTASMLFDAVADARLGRRPAATLQPATQRRLQGLRLLLVEDNPTNQQVAYELLSHDGADVDVASCGQAAIDALRGDGPAPDLILMDIQMPDMDGYAATRAIRAELGWRAPPIVAMTANVMAADREAALAAGMVDHVGKPFDLEQLIEVILRHGRPEGHATPAPAAADQAGAAADGLNGAAALARLGGNKAVYLIALRNFGAESAKASAQLLAALAGQERDAALPLLHTLKGNAGTVGAEHLASLAAQAEQSLKEAAQSAACWEQIAAVIREIPQASEAVDRLAAAMERAGRE
ncbi:response regulator [Janthinobacterium fluminis]|uniref:histidine kinase n=1 Tax=Janthinobacterium fluminis TaxID=2987524 RepID=A0ABT5JW17_9BURK|nr:response regulator [Janthinobacterium fluminis]MDC8756918.1 response regulator [Janthinobacterium fluminis]